MLRLFLISTLVMLSTITATAGNNLRKLDQIESQELELLQNYYAPVLVPTSGGTLNLKESNDQVSTAIDSTVENDNTVTITVAISCFVVFGLLVFIFYHRKRKKKETKISDETTQPLVAEELNVKLNFNLYKD